MYIEGNNPERIMSKEVTTVIELLNKEMVRLQKLRVDKPDWWTNSSSWAKDEFGSNLDTITPLAIERNPESCQVCGHILRLEEKFMLFTFSYCDEYNCGMNICKECLVSMSKELE